MEALEEQSHDWYEKQYTPSYWSKKHATRDDVIQHFVSCLTKWGDETRRNTPSDLGIRYGEGENEKIDYFYGQPTHDKSNKKPVYVYIHGGYWQEGSKDLYSAVTRTFTKKHFNTAVVGYDLAPNSSIPEMIIQLEKAVDHVYSHFNQSKLILYGHSAGAYLAACVAMKKSSYIQSVVLISGIYKLTPLLKTSMNSALHLDVEQAQYLSDLVFEYDVSVPTYVYVGGDESDEFRKQSQIYYGELLKKKVGCEFEVVDNEDHFSIIESLNNEESFLSQKMLKMAENGLIN